jgi:hypothetical protein
MFLKHVFFIESCADISALRTHARCISFGKEL